MPNWVTGDLKVRGSKQHVMKLINHVFTKEQLAEKEHNEPEFPNLGCRCYINNGHLREGIEIFEDSDGDTLILEDFNFAWGITIESAVELQILAKEYDVDFRFYGFERGMQFEEELIIEDGELKQLRDIKYDNYDWESIRPHAGG